MTKDNQRLTPEPSLQNAENNWGNLTQGEYETLQNVPDADALSPDSPVDPSAPEELLHGIDLLNGFDGEEDSPLDHSEVASSCPERTPGRA
ncbi:hypothetical protein D3C74_118500 [compost metagenome]